MRRLHKQVYNFTVNLMNGWPFTMFTDLKGRISIFPLTLTIINNKNYLPRRGETCGSGFVKRQPRRG